MEPSIFRRPTRRASANGTRWPSTTATASFRAGDESAALTQAFWTTPGRKDLRYMTNQDLDAHPRVDQWSNGVNQADELNRIMKIRRAALDRLGEHTIRNGAPMATIEEALVPIFMYHRYSVESAAAMPGRAGLHLCHARRRAHAGEVGDRRANQRKALEALAATLKPSELTVPKQVLDAIPPRPPGFGRHRELFPRTTGDALRSAQPGYGGGGRDHRLRAATRSRGAHGGAACGGSGAAGRWRK